MLTDTQIRKAKSAERDYKLGDSGGLFLLVRANGSKLWRLKYRFGGKEKLLSFGAYPDLTLAEARGRRDQERKLIAQGLDPSLEKKRRAMTAESGAQNTFEQVARRWHEQEQDRWVQRHADDVINSLVHDVFPQLGQFQINDIDPPLVLQTLKKIEARGSIETARRLKQRMSSVFVFGISSGICAQDPAAIVTKALRPKPKARKQPAVIDLSELRELLNKSEASGAYPVTLLASRMLALTATRPGTLWTCTGFVPVT